MLCHILLCNKTEVDSNYEKQKYYFTYTNLYYLPYKAPMLCQDATLHYKLKSGEDSFV